MSGETASSPVVGPRQHARAMDHVVVNDAAHLDDEYPGPWMPIRMGQWPSPHVLLHYRSGASPFLFASCRLIVIGRMSRRCCAGMFQKVQWRGCWLRSGHSRQWRHGEVCSLQMRRKPRAAPVLRLELFSRESQRPQFPQRHNPMVLGDASLSFSGTLPTLACFRGRPLGARVSVASAARYLSQPGLFSPGWRRCSLLFVVPREGKRGPNFHAYQRPRARVTWAMNTTCITYIHQIRAERSRCLASRSPSHESADLRQRHHPDYFYPSTPPCLPLVPGASRPSFRPT